MRLLSSFVARGNGTGALRRLAWAGIGLLAGCGGGSGSEGSPEVSAPSKAGGNPTLRGHVAFVVSSAPASGSVFYIAPLDGSSPAHMVATVGESFHPRFSRDGTSLYYEAPASSGATIRKIAVDGTNDHLVYACTKSCNCLGEDQTDRVFIWTGSLSGGGSLGTLAGEGREATFVPWAANPACAADANLDTAGDTIAIATDCTSQQVFVGGVTAAGQLTGHAMSGVQGYPYAEHIQYAAGRVFLRGFPPGSDETSAPLHVMSMAADGSDVQDLGVGYDFVVSNDASFVLVSQQDNPPGGGGPTYSIVAHVGATTTPVPGLGAIAASGGVTLAWTPH